MYAQNTYWLTVSVMRQERKEAQAGVRDFREQAANQSHLCLVEFVIQEDGTTVNTNHKSLSNCKCENYSKAEGPHTHTEAHPATGS